MKKRALISVYDKQGIETLAASLVKLGWEILSTGGTAQYLTKQQIPVTDVQDATGFPECLDGRVKTLHPVIHAGLLAKRDKASHREALQHHNITPIDLICVNLYPFFEKVQTNLTQDEVLEFIDIGGTALLRSGAKNYQDVIVLTDPKDYDKVIADLQEGSPALEFRKYLAAKVFNLTAAYDAAIAQYLVEEEYPSYLTLGLKKAQALRYGENYHQSAMLYLNADKSGALSFMKQLSGKELGYNNIRDLDLAWKAACAFGLSADGTLPQGEEDIPRFLPNFPKQPPVCCAAVKHNTPCSIALGKDLLEAYGKAYICDPVSIFGGIIACNVAIDPDTAEKLSDLFLEIIVAPDYDPEALEILKKKPALRIIKIPHAPRQTHEYISVDGGVVVQMTDQKLLEQWKVVTQVGPEPQDIPDMIFGMRAITYVKSNAIMVIKNQAALGIGAGETNRIWAAELALNRAERAVTAAARAGTDNGTPGRVMVSDAFFPFPDVAEAAAAGGIKTIVQPGGSMNDREVIETCDKLGLAMVFTGTRHFKH